MTTRDDKLRAMVAEMYGVPIPSVQAYARKIDAILGPRPVAEPAAEGVTEEACRQSFENWRPAKDGSIGGPSYWEAWRAAYRAALTLAGEKFDGGKQGA